MGDMDGGPEAMSRVQIVKAKQEARGVNERVSRVSCQADRMQKFAARGSKSLSLRVNTRPRGYRGENVASWLTSRVEVEEGSIAMLEQAP